MVGKIQKNQNTCAIYLLDIKKFATMDKCKHKFCLSCIKKWEKIS